MSAPSDSCSQGIHETHSQDVEAVGGKKHTPAGILGYIIVGTVTMVLFAGAVLIMWFILYITRGDGRLGG
jgi:hypothetical protein